MSSDRFIELELETITPVFAGGPTPRRIDPYTPIRPSAVRGALRMWFRAAAASVFVPPSTDQDPQDAMRDELAGLEAQVFGNTDRSSPFAVLAPSLDSKNIITHYSPGDPDPRRWPGLRYLGYGLFEDKLKSAQAINAHTRFSLRLVVLREQPGLRQLLGATLWLWLHLGALGARGRRGFGAIRLYPGRHPGFLCPEELRAPAPQSSTLPDHLARGTEWALQVFYDYLDTRQKHLPRPPSRSRTLRLPMRTLAGIETFTPILHAFGDPIEALDFAGRLFRDYRSTLRRSELKRPPLPDYTHVKAALQRGKPPVAVDRAAFGLPLPFYFRSLGGRRTRFIPKRGSVRYVRLASPLCFRVCPVGDAHSPSYVTVLYNWAQAPGTEPLLGCEVWDEINRGTVSRKPDSGIISEFMAWAGKQTPTTAGHMPAPRRR